MRLTTLSGQDIDVRLHEPELLPGVVAIAVPEGSSPVGGKVNVPIADRQVPVLASGTHQLPAPVVAAHDAQHHEFAIVNGLTPIPVLDDDGTVRSTGALDGLGRYAARAAARELLEADGVVIAVEQGPEEVWRCRCCATVLVPQLGRHWILRASDLEVAAADAVRDGLVALTPPDAREAFVAGARARSDWCLSTRVGGGIPIPAASCLDCGKMTVEVEATSSCGRCMGTLVPEALFLDARFVAAIWALALGGWPERGGGMSTAEETVVVVSAAELAAWALPAMALGLRLAGQSPFATAVVHPWPAKPPPLEDWFDDHEADPRAIRLALVGNTHDPDAAAVAVAALDRSASDDVDPVQAAEAVAAGLSALDDGLPAQAAVLLASVLSGGVPAEAAERIRSLTIPILGD
jgi:valyl-tRNA synthetase